MRQLTEEAVGASLDMRVEELVAGESDRDGAFDELALEIFEHQFECCPPYRAFCSSLGRTPANVDTWDEIPAVPTEAFKEAVIATIPPERAEVVFTTSGTSGERPGRVYRDAAGLRLCRAAWLRAHRDFLRPDGASLPILCLTAPPAQAPQASIAHCVAALVDSDGAAGSRWFVDAGGLNGRGLLEALQRAEADGEPVELYGPTFAFLALFDACAESGSRLRLPGGSRVGHGSGYKGSLRTLTPQQFLDAVWAQLGIPAERVVNVLGMSELGSQFYDTVLRDATNGRHRPRHKVGHAWTRTRIVDLETGADMPAGEEGILVHYDLTQRATALAVQTEDVGVAVEDGFEILGRAPGAEARGCNLTIERWLARNG